MDAGRLAGQISELLGDRTVACAESCTAGRVSAVFAGVEGAADWFRGALVAYQVPVKRALLGVEAESVLCEQAAAEMAIGVAELLDASVAVATTGVAGDEPEDGVEPGTVFFATYVDGRVQVATHRFDGSPESVCDAARNCALGMLRHHLGEVVGPSRYPS